MPEVSATEAARNSAGLLEAIEHRGEHFTVVRRGKTVAHLEPAKPGLGVDVKASLRRHPSDPKLDELSSLTRHGRGRGLLLTRLLLDTTFVVDVDRSESALDEAVVDENDVAIAAITVAERPASFGQPPRPVLPGMRHR